jgi:isochorismate synthase EntC
MTQQEAVRETEVEEEKRYADSVRADVKLEEQRELDKKVLKRAHALQQQSHLNEQISLQRAQAARDPGASEMTALEASLNRGLLVSLVQHKYPNPHVLN